LRELGTVVLQEVQQLFTVGKHYIVNIDLLENLLVSHAAILQDVMENFAAVFDHRLIFFYELFFRVSVKIWINFLVQFGQSFGSENFRSFLLEENDLREKSFERFTHLHVGDDVAVAVLFRLGEKVVETLFCVGDVLAQKFDRFVAVYDCAHDYSPFILIILILFMMIVNKKYENFGFFWVFEQFSDERL
jgi:hypothetical protein